MELCWSHPLPDRAWSEHNGRSKKSRGGKTSPLSWWAEVKDGQYFLNPGKVYRSCQGQSFDGGSECNHRTWSGEEGREWWAVELSRSQPTPEFS